MKTKMYYAGTPIFACTALEALLNHEDYEILGVFTQPDRPSGRGQKLSPSPVKELALKYDVPVYQPEKLNDPSILEALPPADLIVVCAYGLLLPQWFLDFPKYGCINIHASLLPRWRGASPIQRAIEAGDLETGVGIMQMEKGLDTGAVWLEKRLPIFDNNAQELHDRLQILGTEALLEAIPLILSGNHQPVIQSTEGITYAQKLNKAEAQIKWSESAEIIARKIRAFNPYPVCFGQIGEQTYRIFSAEALSEISQEAFGTVIKHDKTGIYVQTGQGILKINFIQPAGKKALTAQELRNGNDLTGAIFL